MSTAGVGHGRVFCSGRRIVLAGLLVALIVVLPTRASAVAPSQASWATASAIDAFVTQERADLKLSGLDVVVLSRGEVAFDGVHGDAAPEGSAVTAHTPFVLGSTSKQFTGLAIQQLVAEGDLSMDSRVGTLLGPLDGESSPFADVTAEQLLGHSSGISTNAGIVDEFDPLRTFASLEDESRHLLQSAPSSKPGEKFEYSNGNYTLLGSIIEEVTGQSFEEALQSLVARPLGLDATTSNLELAQAGGLAVGHYTWWGAIDSTTPGPRWPMGAPSAYTTSTAADLTLLLQAELGQPSAIDPAVFAADHAPLTTVNEYSKYASGWYIRPFWELHDHDENYEDPALPLMYEHDGDTARETSYLAFSPDLDFGVVVLSNTGLGIDKGRFSEFTYELLHTIVGTQATPREANLLISAAPTIMVALPLLQLAALIYLAVSLVRPRRTRFGRWIPGVMTALVTAMTLLVVFAVVPNQTQQPLLDRAWWSAVPDLAVSVAVSLLLVAACLIIGTGGIVHALRTQPQQSDTDALPPAKRAIT